MKICIYDSFGRGVYVCVSACLPENLKTIADMCHWLSATRPSDIRWFL